MDYKTKYLKYKQKYDYLKKSRYDLSGGSANVLVSENGTQKGKLNDTSNIHDYVIVSGLISCIAVLVYFLNRENMIERLMSLHFVDLKENRKHLMKIINEIQNSSGVNASVKICLWCNSINPKEKGISCNEVDIYDMVHDYLTNAITDLKDKGDIDDTYVQFLTPIKGVGQIYSQKVGDMFLDPCYPYGGCETAHYGEDNPYERITHFSNKRVDMKPQFDFGDLDSGESLE